MIEPAYPWWLEEALAAGAAEPAAPPLVGRTTADVVIVGGGYTGLWTALALRERRPGLDIVVLEGAIVGAGPSGRNGGFLHGYWEQLPGLVDEFGHGPALAMARAGSRAQDAIRRFATERDEDIWLTESGIVMTATSAAQERVLDRAVANAERLGVADQVEPLTSEDVQKRCASSSFRRGVLFHEAGTVQPARLARALRRAALATGIRLHEGSRATAITGDRRQIHTTGTAGGRRRLPAAGAADGRQVRVPAVAGGPEPVGTAGAVGGRRHVVRTALGEVTCGDVVLATNSALTTDPAGRSSIVNLSSYVSLTEPIPDRLAALGWTGGEGVRDARMFLHYVRTTRDGRIAFGSGSGPIGYRGGRRARMYEDAPTVARMSREFAAMFPELADVRMTHAWGGPIDMASDHAPVVGTRPGTRIHYAMGLSGHGVNPSWILAQIAASLVTGAHDEWTTLPIHRRTAPRLPPEPFRYLGGRAVRSAIMRIESAEDTGTHPPIWARTIREVPHRLGIRVGTRR